jgi:glycerol uptake facilitator-like aquaporin
MNKYITEMIGTFFLVLTVGCTVIGGGDKVIPAFAIGSALMVMIYAGGHISGGHYNPAVTLGVWMRGRCDTSDLVPYWVSQFVCGGLAALVVKFFRAGVAVTPMTVSAGPALLAEGIVHLRPGLRRVELRDFQRHVRQFLLRPGHRFHRLHRSLRGRQHLGCGL